jgi:hypothetical protein
MVPSLFESVACVQGERVPGSLEGLDIPQTPSTPERNLGIFDARNRGIGQGRTFPACNGPDCDHEVESGQGFGTNAKKLQTAECIFVQRGTVAVALRHARVARGGEGIWLPDRWDLDPGLVTWSDRRLEYL